jgi:hypothetical protein
MAFLLPASLQRQEAIMLVARHPVVAIDDLPWIIAAEYDEQPGLRLTFPQFKRQWNLSVDDCQDLLDYMIDSGMLVHGEDDQYRRPERCD